MTGSNQRLPAKRSRVSYAKEGSVSCQRPGSAEADIALSPVEGRRLAVERGVRSLARRLGSARSERSGDTYDGREIRDSCPPETTRLCWVWRRGERSVAGRM